MMEASKGGNNSLHAALAEIIAPVGPHLGTLQAFMEGEVAVFEPEVRELVLFCLEHSGKRIRPMLVFYSGWREDSEEPADALIRAAAVVEFVHLATLVHDDILDDADMRHNTATVAHRYGSDAAVLLGDALFAHALKLASDFPTVAVCRAVAESTRRVCTGEIMQTFLRGNARVSRDTYTRIIDLKTAELFRVSCSLGAMLSGATSDFQDAAAVFGRHLGIAYQIFDDLADYLGTEVRAGKTLGTDLRSGKYTLPLLMLLARVDEREQDTWIEQIGSGALTLETLRERMHANDVFSCVGSYFQEQISAAEAALAPFEGMQAAEYLRRLSEYVKLQTIRINGSLLQPAQVVNEARE